MWKVRSRLVAREIRQCCDKIKDGKRRQPMVLDAKRAFSHADALTETCVKPPHLRDTERCLLLKKCEYCTNPAAAGWQHFVQKVGAHMQQLSMCVRTHFTRFGQSRAC